MSQDILLSWSGGKDSAMALYELQKSGEYRVASLLTTVTAGYDRISMHGVRRALLEEQAEALGLPLHKILISPKCANAEYEAKMAEALAHHQQNGVSGVAFGDIFLEDLRAYREQKLAPTGLQAIFPIWKRDTSELALSFIQLGFRAVVACLDLKRLDRSFAGAEINEEFLRRLPSGVDPCGENGEFHTFVFDGPNFRRPIPFTRGEVVERDGFIFCDLVPAESRTAGADHARV
jgi:uncharacterized protein (TIGR00290 family)